MLPRLGLVVGQLEGVGRVEGFQDGKLGQTGRATASRTLYVMGKGG